ncbi:ArsC/Spx/MgsR family protein, partial [Psychrobacter sp.]|uniref:ArsC/Spx/MgsR family protein n=1 Tax=Psychrobacter sp. TaxID=56811 RepID=UPI0025E9626F
VLNKRGTTWRKLSDEQKQAADSNVDAAIDLLVENSSMIKRPIVEGKSNAKVVLLCGFNIDEFEEAFKS